MKEHYQTFYQRPYSIRAFSAFIFLSIILFAYLREPCWTPQASAVFGFVLGTCFWAIVSDPDTAYRTTKRLGNENEGGDTGREITVVGPLIGFECFKYQLKTPDYIWVDVVRYEDALIRD